MVRFRLSSDKSHFPHGRGWLHLDAEWHKAIGVEWAFGMQHSWGVSLDLNWGDSDGVMLFVGIPLIGSFFVELENIVPKQWMPGHWAESQFYPGKAFWYPEQREIGVKIYDQKIWAKLWANPMEWHRGQPWWWEFTISPLDILLGREKYMSRDISQGSVNVWMPEGIYPAKYKVVESTWKRPRWPMIKRAIRTEIELEQSIPFSGKGENSWDCGEDGLWCIMLHTDDPQEAARQTAQSTLETRRKRGDPRRWPVAPRVP